MAAPEPAAFDLIEKAIEEFDMKVAVHNHGPEEKAFPAPQDAYQLLKGRDPRFGLWMDIGHATRAGWTRSRPSTSARTGCSTCT